MRIGSRVMRVFCLWIDRRGKKLGRGVVVS